MAGSSRSGTRADSCRWLTPVAAGVRGSEKQPSVQVRMPAHTEGRPSDGPTSEGNKRLGPDGTL